MMQNNELITKYMQFNKVLISTIHVKEKRIEVFDGEKNQSFDFKSFFDYFVKYFELNKELSSKFIDIVGSINENIDTIEIENEFKGIDGSDRSFTFNVIKQSDDQYYLFIKEYEVSDFGQIDQMTKANSKTYIDNRAKSDILTNTPFVLAYIDIDNFKQVNDEYGQLIGDMILIEMVSVGKNYIGNRGTISREGDRFLLLYEIEDNYDKVHYFLFELKQILQKISAATSRGIKITVTIGSAQYPSDGNYEALLEKSKKALIRGKLKGRDCFVMYIEKNCKDIDINDEKKVRANNHSNNIAVKNDIYSLITDVNQLLNDDVSVDESIDKALSLTGTYFYIDRISIARLDIKNQTIMKHHAWYNPLIRTKYVAYCINEIMGGWAQALGSKHYIKVGDSKELEDDNPLKEYFKVDNTTASMSFELVVNGKSFGLIRFDMTTGPRHWQLEDFQAFLLISQLFASYFQKNYLKDTNYQAIYLDPKFKCYNFTKFFSDAGEYVINTNVLEYTILEFDFKNIINIKTLIGDNRIIDLVKNLTNVFESIKSIYGKRHEGAFVIFIDGHDKNKVDKLFDEIIEVSRKFAKENFIPKLVIEAGCYMANSKNDAFIDAIYNATLARIMSNDNLVYYSEEVKKAYLFKTEMLLRIDEAIENGEFLLYLQPKISTEGGKLVGAEALTRWNYKKEKLLFPDEFIFVLEEHGVIDKLDYSVLENVCKYQKMVIDSGIEPVTISVNVSRSVNDFDTYMSNVEKIRQKYGINPNLIEFEITEGMYYEKAELISGFIDKIHKYGYEVSMDDFGSGYSNLVSIAKFNFDTIKFDRSFCLDLDNINVKIMLEKLIELIKSMKMHTLCEGVETHDNVLYLTKIGCDSIQGYYYSKPIPWEKFKEKYQSNK